MVSCEGCGAAVDANDKECPYCGHSILQRAEAEKSALENQEVYGVVRDEEGDARIHFGDGQTGSRPSSSGNLRTSQYRQGAGSGTGNLSKDLEEKLDHVDRQIEKVPNLSKQDGTKDMGDSMIESMSAIGDLLSFYQSDVAREAYLSDDDRERLSKKEERIRPKLESMVTFCERVDSKTQKKMGLTDSDIRKIKTTATKALQMTESGKCSKCGAMHRLGTTRCQNCGAHL